MKRKAAIFTLMGVLAVIVIVSCIYFNGNKDAGLYGSNSADYNRTVEKICTERGYLIKDSGDFDMGDNSYSSSYVSLKRSDSGYDIQILIGKSAHFDMPNLSINIDKEIYSEHDKLKGIEKDFCLIVDLINEFSEEKITEEMLKRFLSDDKNVTEDHEVNEYETYKVITKMEELNISCGIIYQVYTNEYERKDNEYIYQEGASLEEEMSIGVNPSLNWFKIK